MSNIHKNLKQLRLTKNYTQEDVAQLIGLTRQAISSYESGRTQPGIDLLMKFAEIYEVELDEILYGRKTADFERKRIKIVFLIVVFAWLFFLIAEIGMRLWADRAYYPMEDTIQINSSALREAIDRRFEYLNKANVCEGLAYYVLWIGGIILVVLDLIMKKPVSIALKCKIIGIWLILAVGVAFLGGILFPLYKIHYIWIVFYCALNVLILIIIDCIGQWIKRRMCGK